jgi:hypothetical protein
MDLPAYSRHATDLIRARYSCRVFEDERIPAGKLDAMTLFAASLGPGPRGGKPRFALIAAGAEDPGALRGLGTYGFIQNPQDFLAVVRPSGLDMIDLGWATELAVLKASELGLGSCWLGGAFRRSRFARAADLQPGERLAIVVALGLEAPGARDAAIRRRVAGATRKPWAEVFFDGGFGGPIADPAALADSALAPGWHELSPSASNKQPWALARTGAGWELFLRKAPGYRVRLARMNDMGIAMAHLALAAREKGIAGEWRSASPSIAAPDAEYVATFGR